MCRWLAYYGKPIRMDKVLFQGQYSLIDQSLKSRLGAEPTNGDGFGIGWYSAAGDPGVFKDASPPGTTATCARSRATSSRTSSSRTSVPTTGTPVQETNCHPFHYGKWLWMHNGVINDWLTIKRDLVLAVDPALYPLIEGTTDSEVLFYLALTLGLEEDPSGRSRARDRPRRGDRASSRRQASVPGHDRHDERRADLGVPLLERGPSRSLYFSTLYDTLKAMYPDDPRLEDFDEETRIVVSEPLGDVLGVWNQAPEASWGVVQPGQDEMGTFRPAAPAAV